MSVTTWGFLVLAPRMRIEAGYRPVLFWSALTAVYALCACYAASIGVMQLDEFDHFEQIQRFRHGIFSPFVETLTTIPGYHLVVAALLRLVGGDSFAAARLVTSVFGLFAVVGFHRLRSDAVGHEDYLATAQFAVLPIFFLFAFMVQTDAASLALTLWAAWAAGRQRHWLAGFFLLAAEGMRQNNVLWLALLAWPIVGRIGHTRAGLAGFAQRILPYALAAAAFVAYWAGHGSVVLARGQLSAHPDFSLHSGNLFYLMFLGAILFVFPCVDSWLRFVASVRQRPWLIAVPLGLAAAYLATFKVDHPFNLIQPPDLRDWLLMRTQASTLWYCGFGAVAVFGGLGLLWQKLLTRDTAVFWAVTALFVSLSWLIEQRYYLIPYALFMAWRAPQPEWAERATLALWAPLAVLLFWGMMTGQLYI